MIALIAILVPTTAAAYSLHQQRLYAASAEVLLSTQNLADSLTGTPGVAQSQDPARVATTESQVAQTAPVASLALADAGIHRETPLSLLDRSSVTASPTSNILTFEVRDAAPQAAVRLANSYASAYTTYRAELDTAAISKAARQLGLRIAQVGHRPAQRALLNDLNAKLQQLQTLAALQSSNAQVVQPASRPTNVQPKLARNIILGVVLGLALAVGLAYLRQSFDTRVRSMEDVDEMLDIPLLARIPTSAGSTSDPHKPVMFHDPGAPQAEAIRILRTALEFTRLDAPRRIVAVTSAIAGEGKSTTVANLAIAEARSGRDVILIDLDLRQPTLDKFFRIDRTPGVTDVVIQIAESRRESRSRGDSHSSPVQPDLGSPVSTPLRQDSQALRTQAPSDSRVDVENGNAGRPVGPIISALIEISDLRPQGHDSSDRDEPTEGAFRGKLRVLPAGVLPPDPGEVIGSSYMADLLAAASSQADLVLIDTPPLLGMGDAVTLSQHLDGLILIVRLDVLKRPMLREVRRLLDTTPAKALGYALAGAEHDELFRYGAYGYGNAARVH